MTRSGWWMADPGSTVLWAEVLLLWAAANYLVCADPTREVVDGTLVSAPFNKIWTIVVVVRALVAAGTSAWLSSSMFLALIVLAFCLGVPLSRRSLRPSWVAEFETLITAGFLALATALIATKGLVSHYTPPWPPQHFAAGCLVVALFLFAVRGGTYIVRGILDKCGALPPILPQGRLPLPGETVVDCSEINRGRLIGNLERILLVILVAFGNYEALGFLVAAKGLIRSKDLEDRNWAEYFLVGTLASVLVAVGVGLCVRLVLKTLW